MHIGIAARITGTSPEDDIRPAVGFIHIEIPVSPGHGYLVGLLEILPNTSVNFNRSIAKINTILKR